MKAEEIDQKMFETRDPIELTALLHQRMYVDPPLSRELLIFWCGALSAMIQSLVRQLAAAHDR